MKKKILALASFALVATATAGTATLLTPSVSADAGMQAKLEACVDISSDSWVNGENGWRKGRYGGRSITNEQIGVTLGAYTWEGTEHWLVWGGGGFDASSGLYDGGDFAVSFATELTLGGVAVVIDQFSLWLTPTAIKLGYDEHPDVGGVFGDGLIDYAPAFWTTDLDILHGRDVDWAKWLVQEEVNFSGLVSVDAYVGTDEAGVTTLAMRVNDTVVSATTERTRMTSVHGGIMSQNAKIYSQKATQYEAQIDSAVSAIDPALYTGALKATVDAKASEAKTAILSQSDLTASFAEQKVAEVKTAILELTSGTVVDDADLYLKLCKDVADDSWVSSGFGWMKGRYGGRTLSSAQLSCTLDAYAWDGTKNSLVWAGGGWPVHEFGRLLYQEGSDFALSFFAEVPQAGFAVVVDNFVFVVTPTAIKIGYNDMRGAFGDALQDYNPGYWLDLYSEGGVPYGWIANESVNLSDVVSVRVYLGTDEAGVTTLVMQVNDTLVSTISSHARIAGWHTAIVARSEMKVYTGQVASYAEQIDETVAGLDESIYTGEVKTIIDSKVQEAKRTLWNTNDLTSAQASQAVASVMEVILTYAQDAYFAKCKDIADSAWATDTVGGWVKYDNAEVGFNDEYLTTVLPKYKWQTDHLFYWAGGTSGEGNLYQEGDDFALKFIADMTEDGLVVRVDNFSIWVNASGIQIGFNNEPGDGDNNTDDFSRTYWVINIDILEERGGTVGAWLAKKEVALSGKVEISTAISTNDNGMTTILVKAGDTAVSAMTTVERKYLDRCVILAGYQDIALYSTKITDAVTAVAKAKDSMDSEVYANYADTVDAFLLASQREIWELENYTLANLNGIVNGVQTMIADFTSFTEACKTAYTQDGYSESGWTKIQEIIEEVSAGYFTCSVSEIEEYKAVAFARLDGVLTAEEEEALALLRLNAKSEIDKVPFVQENYSETAWTTIQELIASYKAQIDTETDETQLAILVDAFKADAGSVLTLLQTAVLEYKAELDTFVATLTESEYSAENWQTILGLCESAKAEIAEMTDESTMQSKVQSTKTEIGAVPKIPVQNETEDSSSGNENSSASSGCGSSMGVGVVFVALLVCVTVLLRKRIFLNKED